VHLQRFVFVLCVRTVLVTLQLSVANSTKRGSMVFFGFVELRSGGVQARPVFNPAVVQCMLVPTHCTRMVQGFFQQGIKLASMHSQKAWQVAACVVGLAE
jgi:hypothetical protein